jgi:hypothetical protein
MMLGLLLAADLVGVVDFVGVSDENSLGSDDARLCMEMLKALAPRLETKKK